jgi:hypothetical protein
MMVLVAISHVATILDVAFLIYLHCKRTRNATQQNMQMQQPIATAPNAITPNDYVLDTIVTFCNQNNLIAIASRCWIRVES